MNFRNRMLIAAAFAGAVATPAAAQEFTFHNTTTFKMGGVLGFAARLGGVPKETVETSYLSGHKLRTDVQDASTIIDADAGVITTINRKNKTYTTMSFEQMADMARQAQSQMSRSQPEKAAKTTGDNDVKIKYSAKVEVTGEQDQINGMKARRALLTVTVDADARPEGGDQAEHAGSLIVLTDMWNASDAAHARALKDFHQAYARKAASELGASGRGLTAVFAAYPGMEEAMAAAAREMQKIGDVPVRTVTYVVLVPAEKKFDRDLALAGGKAANETANKEKAGIGRKLGGLLSQAGKSDSGSEKQEELEQVTIMSVTTELQDVQQGGVPADAFAVPAGYKEQKLRAQ